MAATNSVIDVESLRASLSGVFCDAAFPADSTSLGGAGGDRVEWLRPTEFLSNPTLFRGPYPDVLEVQQGKLGDCFFISAVTVVGASNPDTLMNLFCTRSFDAKGLYAFRLFKDNEWQTVVIDDRIPCKGGEPIFAHTNTGEVWICLLEKAYAKLYGSFRAIAGGSASEALVDLTGVPVRDIKMDDMSAEIRSGELAAQLVDYMDKGCALACAAVAPGGAHHEPRDGILVNHAYGVLAVRERRSRYYVNLFNPWGRDVWQANRSRIVQQDLLAELDGDTVPPAGSFWMPFAAYAKAFNRTYVSQAAAGGASIVVEGEWTPGGGCTSYATWRSDNPHFALTVRHKTRVVLCISQEDVRGKVEVMAYNQIGLTVVRTPTLSPCLTNGNYELVAQSKFWNKREVSLDAEFAASATPYIVVPSTFYPNQPGKFWLTARSDAKVSLERVAWEDRHEVIRAEGQWAGKTAGGRPAAKTFRNNPQYRLSLPSASDVHVILGQDGDGAYDGAGIYLLAFAGGRFIGATMPASAPIGSFKFTNACEVSRSESLPVGDYLVIPCTYEARKERRFRLSVFACQGTTLEELPFAAVSDADAERAAPAVGLAGDFAAMIGASHAPRAKAGPRAARTPVAPTGGARRRGTSADPKPRRSSPPAAAPAAKAPAGKGPARAAPAAPKAAAAKRARSTKEAVRAPAPGPRAAATGAAKGPRGTTGGRIGPGTLAAMYAELEL